MASPSELISLRKPASRSRRAEASGEKSTGTRRRAGAGGRAGRRGGAGAGSGGDSAGAGWGRGGGCATTGAGAGWTGGGTTARVTGIGWVVGGGAGGAGRGNEGGPLGVRLIEKSASTRSSGRRRSGVASARTSVSIGRLAVNAIGPRAQTAGQPLNRPVQTTPHRGHEHVELPATIGCAQPSWICGPNS